MAPAAESIQPEAAPEFDVAAATAVDTPSTADVAAGTGYSDRTAVMAVVASSLYQLIKALLIDL